MKPRQFYFDFVKQGKTDRFVAWGDGQAFHSWWQATQVKEDYPQGRGANAFAADDQPTLGSVQLVAALLFPGAGLGGTITEFGDATDAGVEAVSDRQCRKLVGTAKTVYRTGRTANVRPATVWIDADTNLVRRVLEEAAQGTAPNYLNRRVTTIEPQANPPVDDATFTFAPPKSLD